MRNKTEPEPEFATIQKEGTEKNLYVDNIVLTTTRTTAEQITTTIVEMTTETEILNSNDQLGSHVLPKPFALP